MYSIQRNKKETGSVLFSGGKNRLGVIILSRRGGGWENRLLVELKSRTGHRCKSDTPFVHL